MVVHALLFRFLILDAVLIGDAVLIIIVLPWICCVVVFDWDFGASGGDVDGRDSANSGRHPTSHNKLVDGVPRLRDAGAPSAPVIVPGPALIPSMGGGQTVRLSNGRARKSRINEANLQLLPNVPSG
jgi:hypothetical protein